MRETTVYGGQIDHVHKKLVNVSLNHRSIGLLGCYQHLTYRIRALEKLSSFPRTGVAELKLCRDSISAVFGVLLDHDAKWFRELEPAALEQVNEVLANGLEP